MAKIVIERRDCKLKIAQTCKGFFERTPQRGRPPVGCPDCMTARAKVKVVRQPKAPAEPISLDRTCGCGAVFQIKPGRGGKATKCDACREAGKVYRMDDEGVLQEIQAEVIRREQAEKAEQAGKERAQLLVDMMRPLLAKRNRQVIVH
jgi:hypothetical protein